MIFALVGKDLRKVKFFLTHTKWKIERDIKQRNTEKMRMKSKWEKIEKIKLPSISRVICQNSHVVWRVSKTPILSDERFDFLDIIDTSSQRSKRIRIIDSNQKSLFKNKQENETKMKTKMKRQK